MPYFVPVSFAVFGSAGVVGERVDCTLLLFANFGE